LEEYKNIPLKATFTPAKGNGPLATAYVVLALPEARIAPLPPLTKGLEESSWRATR